MRRRLVADASFFLLVSGRKYNNYYNLLIINLQRHLALDGLVFSRCTRPSGYLAPKIKPCVSRLFDTGGAAL